MTAPEQNPSISDTEPLYNCPTLKKEGCRNMHDCSFSRKCLAALTDQVGHDIEATQPKITRVIGSNDTQKN